MSKAKAQRNHAKKRSVERFGAAIGDTGLAKIVAQIQNGQAKFVERQSLRISVWEIDYHGQRCNVVYDKQRKTIVTFLFTDDSPLAP